jgi:hypothetical protein
MRGRPWPESAAAAIVAGLAVLTAVWPDWIEGLTGQDPDNGSGSLELYITAAFAVAAGGGNRSHKASRRSNRNTLTSATKAYAEILAPDRPNLGASADGRQRSGARAERRLGVHYCLASLLPSATIGSSAPCDEGEHVGDLDP